MCAGRAERRPRTTVKAQRSPRLRVVVPAEGDNGTGEIRLRRVAKQVLATKPRVYYPAMPVDILTEIEINRPRSEVAEYTKSCRRSCRLSTKKRQRLSSTGRGLVSHRCSACRQCVLRGVPSRSAEGAS